MEVAVPAGEEVDDTVDNLGRHDCQYSPAAVAVANCIDYMAETVDISDVAVADCWDTQQKIVISFDDYTDHYHPSLQRNRQFLSPHLINTLDYSVIQILPHHLYHHR